jgi:hypothetical protein
LRQIETGLQQWQRDAIDEAAPVLQLMAIHTTGAIRSVNERPEGLWRPEFQKLETALQTESRDLARLLGNFAQYGRARAKEEHLAKALKLKTSS